MGSYADRFVKKYDKRHKNESNGFAERWLEKNKDRDFEKSPSSYSTSTSFRKDGVEILPGSALDEMIKERDAFETKKGYSKYRYASDFKKNSAVTGSKGDKKFYLFDPSTWKKKGDDLYDFINDIDGYREHYAATQGGPAQSYNDYEDYAVMNSDEIDMYNYLYNKQGQDKANQYLSDIRSRLGERKYEAREKELNRMAEENPVAMSLLSVPTAMVGGVVSAVDLAAQNLERLTKGEPVSYYSSGQRAGAAAQILRDAVGKEIEDNTDFTIAGKNVGRFVYDTAMSAADSLAVGGLGKGLGGALLGINAATSTARDIAARGGNDNQAIIGGIAAGVFEGLFERLSIGNFEKLKEVPVATLKDFGLNLAKAMGVNASEEALTETANLITDKIILGDLSTWDTTMAEFEAQGMDRNEARRQTIKVIAGQIAEAAASGALMGVGFGGLSSASSALSSRSIGSQIQDVDPLRQAAMEMQDSDSQRLAQKIGEEPSRMQKGTLLRTLAEDTAARYMEQGMAEGEARQKAADDVFALLEPKKTEVAAQVQQTEGADVKPTEAPVRAADVKMNITASPAPVMQDRGVATMQKAVYNDSGAEVEIEGISSVENGQVYVQLSDGGTADVDDISFDDPEIDQLYAQAADFDTDTAKAFIAGYEGGSVSNYLKGFKSMQGSAKAGLTYEQASESVYTQEYLTENGRQYAYAAGQRAAAPQQTAGTEVQVPVDTQQTTASKTQQSGYGVVREYSSKLGTSQSQILKGIDAVAKAIKRKVHIVDTIPITDAKGSVVKGMVNAYFDESTNEYYIALDSIGEAYSFFALHESIHDIAANNELGYASLEEIVFDVLKEQGADIDALMEVQKNLYPNEGEAYWREEIVANTVPAILTDKATADMFIERIIGADADTRTVFERILDSILDFLQKAYDVLKGEKSWQQMELVKQNRDAIERIRDAYFAALEDLQGAEVEQNAAIKGPIEMVNDAAVKYSLKTWTESERETARKTLIKAGFDASVVDRWIEDVNGIAAVVAADRDRLDFTAAEHHIMLKDNQEYVKTLEASTLCAKRLLYQGTFNRIQHLLPNTVLSSEMLIDLRNMMAKKYESPCGICYVESRRRHLGKFAAEWLAGYDGEYKPALDEVTTTDGLEQLRVQHPQAYKDFVDAMNRKGSNNPKVVQLRTAYNGDVRKLTKSQIAKIKKIGGLRVQSFSDFETVHLLDMMQAILDMSAMKLTSQAYTKVPNFAWVFGDTGIKINLSLVAEGTGLDENGNLIFSDTEGMPLDVALQIRKRYGKNVGTIIVGTSDAHILKCMADDRIDFIIPFHKSGWGERELAMIDGLSGYSDYTAYQSENRIVGYYKNGKPKMKKVSANLSPADYWDYSKTGKENAEKYLKLCAEDGRVPKFYNFLFDNGDGSYSLQLDGSTDGYWKLLIDFRMYDNEGDGAPQTPVKPNFNMQEAIRALNEYQGDADTLPVANDIVKEFLDKYAQRAVDQSVDAQTEQEAVEFSDANIKYSMRDEPPPKKTGTAYKVFVAKDGQLYPPMVANPRGEGTPVGVWLNADAGEMSEPSKTGRPQVRAGGKGTGTGKTSLAYRPGWHLGDIPLAKQFARKNPETGVKDLFPANFVWAECEYAMDVDYQEEAMSYGYTENGKFRHSYAGLPRLPKDGYYRYRTNPNPDTVPWVITGAMRVTRILTDAETDEICRKNGVEPMQRQGGAIDLAKFGLEAGPTTGGASNQRKFSLNDTASVSTAALESELAKKDKVIADLKAQFKLTEGHKVSDKALNKLAGKILKEYSSSYDRETLVDNLRTMFNYIANTEQPAWEDIVQQGTELAKAVLQKSSQMDAEIYERYSEAREYLRNTPIVLNNEQRAEAAYLMDSYRNYRQALFGSVKLTNEGTDLADAWKELTRDYPELFNEEANASDMVSDLLSAVSIMKPAYKNPYGYDMDGAAYDLFLSIYDEYFEIPEVKTFADKKAAELAAVKAKFRSRIAQMRQDSKAKYDAKLKKLRAENVVKRQELSRKYKEALAKQHKADIQRYREQYKMLSDRKNEQLMNQKAAFQAWKEKDRVRSDVRKYQQRIEKKAKDLSAWLLRPTDKKHVPESLRNEVSKFLETLEFTGSAKAAEWRYRMEKLAAFMEKLDNAEGETIYLDLEDSFAEAVRNIAKTGGNLATMDVEQLKELDTVLGQLKKAVQEVNTILVNGRRQELSDYGDEVIAKADVKGPKYGGNNAVAKLLSSGNIKPVYFFKNLGGPMQKLFNEIREAQNKVAFGAQAAKEFYENAAAKHNLSRWKDDTLKMRTERGDTIEITRQQAMSLYAIYKRELANKDATGAAHLSKGGFVYADEQTKERTGKFGIKTKTTFKDAKPKPLSPADMAKISGWLTTEQKAFADELVEYMSTTMAGIGNTTSLKISGYKKFAEGYYFPYKSSRAFLNTQAGTAGQDNNNRWKNWGSAKATQAGANNPIVLQDFTEVWADHVNEMLMYAHMSIPQENLLKVFNYRTRVTDEETSQSVKAAIQNAYGEAAMKYIDTLLADLGGNVLADPRDNFGSKLTSRFKKGAVLASLSVAIQQPSAIVRAMALVDPKYFVTTAKKGSYDEAMKYAGTAVIKRIGGFDTGTGHGMADWITELDPDTKLDKIKAFVGKDSAYRDKILGLGPGKMDEITWGHLWEAVKNEVAAEKHLKPRTAEHLEAAGKRFNDVVEYTQVYDSTISRSELMRSKSAAAQMATAFMAEPVTAYNMLYDAFVNKTGVSKRRALIAFIGSTVFNALLKSIVYAARDDDEDQAYREKYVEAVTDSLLGGKAEKISWLYGLGSDLNPINLIPYARDIASIMQGYDVERADMALIGDFVGSLEIVFNDNKTIGEKIRSIAEAISAFFGIPLKNVLRDTEAIYDSAKQYVFGDSNFEVTERGIQKAIRSGLGSEDTVKAHVENLYSAYEKGNTRRLQQAINEISAQYTDKVDALMRSGKTRQEAEKSARSSILTSCTNVLKPYYLSAPTVAKKMEIRSLALRIKIGNRQLYAGYDFDQHWK